MTLHFVQKKLKKKKKQRNTYCILALLVIIFFSLLVIPFPEGFSNFIKKVKKTAILLFLRKKEFTSSRQTHYISAQKAACLGNLFLTGTSS